VSEGAAILPLGAQRSSLGFVAVIKKMFRLPLPMGWKPGFSPNILYLGLDARKIED
jgi:hypothetical protein